MKDLGQYGFMKNRVSFLSEEEALEAFVKYGVEPVVISADTNDYEGPLPTSTRNGFFVHHKNGVLFDVDNFRFINKRPPVRHKSWGIIRRTGLFQYFIAEPHDARPFTSCYGSDPTTPIEPVLNFFEGRVRGGISVAYVDPKEHSGVKFYIRAAMDDDLDHDREVWYDNNCKFITANNSPLSLEITNSSANYGHRLFNEFWKLTPDDKEFLHKVY